MSSLFGVGNLFGNKFCCFFRQLERDKMPAFPDELEASVLGVFKEFLGVFPRDDLVALPCHKEHRHLKRRDLLRQILRNLHF